MKRGATSPSPPLPIPACKHSRPGKVPRVRVSCIHQPVTLLLQGSASAAPLVCPGRVPASSLHYCFSEKQGASVSFLFYCQEHIHHGSSECTGIPIWPLLPAAGTDWPVVSLPSETRSLGLRTAPKMGQYFCLLFMESTPALPGLSRTKAVRKESLVPLGKDLSYSCSSPACALANHLGRRLVSLFRFTRMETVRFRDSESDSFVTSPSPCVKPLPFHALNRWPDPEPQGEPANRPYSRPTFQICKSFWTMGPSIM